MAMLPCRYCQAYFDKVDELRKHEVFCFEMMELRERVKSLEERIVKLEIRTEKELKERIKR